ncbi:hypothetical protein [Dolichospermum phage Dfl-JY45]
MINQQPPKAPHDEVVIDAACAYLLRAITAGPGERITKVLRDLLSGEIPVSGAGRLHEAAASVRRDMANRWARGASWVGSEREYDALGAALKQADIDLVLLQWVADATAGRPAFRGLKASAPGGTVAWQVAVTVADRAFVWDAPDAFPGPREACLAATEARRLWLEGQERHLAEAPWREVARKPGPGGVHADLGGPAIPSDMFLGHRRQPDMQGVRFG